MASTDDEVVISDERTVHGNNVGAARVTSTGVLLLAGTLNGAVRVEAGGHAMIEGTLNGALTVDPGGSASIGYRGTIGGAIINDGTIENSGTRLDQVIGDAVVDTDSGRVVHGVEREDGWHFEMPSPR